MSNVGNLSELKRIATAVYETARLSRSSNSTEESEGRGKIRGFSLSSFQPGTELKLKHSGVVGYIGPDRSKLLDIQK